MMKLHADRFTVVDDASIPTGEVANVKGTPLDFTTPHTIGERIDSDHEQIRFGSGYDHNFVINGAPGELCLGAEVRHEKSGRKMIMKTTEPGFQFYSANHLPGDLPGHGGRNYPRRHGFCLETQHYPDSPNKPDFPTTRLNPGETYQSTTIYQFSIQS